MEAYVLIKIRAGEVRDVVRQLSRVDGVKRANMTFGPFDAIALVETDDLNHLGRMIASAISPIPGILDTLTCLAVEL
jgi:DNA-binding Lrp family transcriptional regulator